MREAAYQNEMKERDAKYQQQLLETQVSKSDVTHHSSSQILQQREAQIKRAELEQVEARLRMEREKAEVCIVDSCCS